MSQKILKVGSSLAVTIPKKSLKELGFKAGGMVNVQVDTSKKQMVIKAASNKHDELISWTDKFIEKYKTALKELADK